MAHDPHEQPRVSAPRKPPAVDGALAALAQQVRQQQREITEGSAAVARRSVQMGRLVSFTEALTDDDDNSASPPVDGFWLVTATVSASGLVDGARLGVTLNGNPATGIAFDGAADATDFWQGPAGPSFGPVYLTVGATATTELHYTAELVGYLFHKGPA